MGEFNLGSMYDTTPTDWNNSNGWYDFGSNYSDAGSSSGDAGYNQDANVAGNMNWAQDPEYLKSLGFTGQGITPGSMERDSGGDFQTVGQGLSPELKSWMQQNGYTARESQGELGGSSALFGRDNKMIGDPYHFDPDPGADKFGLAAMAAAAIATGGIASAGLGGASAAPAYMGPGSAGAGAAGEGALPSLWNTVGNGALKGAGWNSGITAVSGGKPGDILKSGLMGAVGGGFGAGLGSINPASMMGIDNPAYQAIANRGISGAGSALLTGGNPLTSGLMGAGMSGINQVGNGVYNNFMQSMGSDEMPDVGTLGGTMTDQYGENSATLGGETTPTQLDANINNPQIGASGNENPFKKMIASALGFGSDGATTGGSKGFGNVGDMAGSLMGMYSAFQQRKKLGALAGNLSSMYGPNSPYAQQLNQALSRRDAASGRRSQYGPREVELQAKLAEMNSRNAPTLANIYNQQQQSLDRGLGGLVRMGQRSGAFDTMGGMISPYLAQMFNSPMGQPNVGPQPDFGYEG